MEKKIIKEFENPISGLKGVEQIRKQLSTKDNPLTTKEVKTALEKSEAYTLNRPATRNFDRRRVQVSGIDDQWQADLADVSRQADDNKGIKYLLTVIDVFSKYAWVKPLKVKQGIAVAKALEEIFKERTPRKLQTDDGKEFYNQDVAKVLNKYNVHLFSTNSEFKAQIVERFNRTLKEKIFAYFDISQSFTYIDTLPTIVKNYNEAIHSSIKMKPIDVNKSNEAQVFDNLYGLKPTPQPKLKVGDYVRISKEDHIFRKGYEGNWSIEVFKIREVQATTPVTYLLDDLMGEDVEGGFYEKELQKVGKPTLRIEKVLKHRTKDGKKEKFVQYLGYPEKFNAWIPNEK